tara:strand:+ start:6093 stop:6569 length:477 start_codon:yes stop_codon:yes gene_type:complete
MQLDRQDKAQTLRSKTSLRIRYEVQAERIKQEIGDLERIRQRLGLSKRKVCQLLLIDPSTWTRWTNFSGAKPPPHIYRMLQWYLILQEQHPQMHSDYWLRSYTNQTQDAEQIEQGKRILELENKIQAFEKQSKKQVYVLAVLSLCLLLAVSSLILMME